MRKNKNISDGSHEDTGSEHQHSAELREKTSKIKKSLRFDLGSVASAESFISAKSHEEDDEDEYEDFFPTPRVFNKRKNVVISHTRPRDAGEPSCVNKGDPSPEILATASSLILFEISKTSPSPSDVNIQLVQGIYLRQLDAVKRAISNGADVNIPSEGQTPLLIATELGDARIVAYLLSLPQTNVDVQNEFGQTPISSAVRHSNEEIMRLLLNHKADMNIPDHMGRYPLHNALFQQRTSCVKLLLAYGAQIEVEDCFGERPIYTSAVKKPNRECLNILLKMGANVNYLNVSGIPLLSRTILNGTDFSVIKMLVTYGASVNLPDIASRRTPLHFAAIANNVTAAEFLISRGANPNMMNILRYTPCDVANLLQNEETAEYLENVTKTLQRKSMFLKKKKRDTIGNIILYT